MSTEDKKYCYPYPRPIVTADAVVLCFDEERLKILLIERKWGLFAGMRSLPGGWLDYQETAEAAVKRELEEETAIKLEHFIQLGAFTDPARDTEEYSITVGFLALARAWEHEASGGDDAADAGWFVLDKMPKLAFDHDDIVNAARRKLCAMATVGIAGVELLPDTFPLRMLYSLHKQIFKIAPDKRSFHRRFMQDGLLVALDEYESGTGQRERLYRFNTKACKKLLHRGVI